MSSGGRPKGRRVALTGERGAVAVLVAIFMVALLVIAALVLDLGTDYDHHRELQSAADAGALAGAQELINPAGNPTGVAQQYIAMNVSPGDGQSSVKGANVSASIVPAARSVTVDLTESHVPYNFAEAIGVAEGSAKAHARADLMYLTATPMISPVAIPYLHPANFNLRYGYGNSIFSGANAFDVQLTNGGGASGTYSGGATRSLSSGHVYAAVLSAKDANGNDLMLPINVGSIYVPASSTSPVQTVNLSRGGMGGSAESVTISVGTYQVTDPTEQVDVKINSGAANPVTLNPSGSGYSGTVTVSPGSWSNGVAVISFVTHASSVAGSTWPSGQTLATYTMFQPGQSILYVDQSAWSGSGSTAISATVQTKSYDLGSNVIVTSSDLAFQGSYGATGFADMLSGANFSQELQVALGLIPMNPSWKLNCDANGNGQADIGEQVPIDPTIRSTWGNALTMAQGKTMLVALVASSYPTTTRPAWLTWLENIPFIGPIIQSFFDSWFAVHTQPTKLPIVNFGAIQVSGVSVSGPDFTLSGTWTRYLSTGAWTAVKPSGLYVETAVLTE